MYSGIHQAATHSQQESSQADSVDTTVHSSHSILPGMPEREIGPPPSPLMATLVNLSEEALCLQTEMNDTMIHLFSASAALEMCHQWITSKTDINQHQNDIDTSVAIREVKTQFIAMIVDAEATIKKVEANCLASINKVKVTHVAGIRKAKATYATQVSKLHQQHQEAIQHLEEEALEVEKQAQQSFLWACGAALQACPNKALAKLMYQCTY